MNHSQFSQITGKSQPILFVEDSEDDYEAAVRAFGKANLHNPISWCRSGHEALDFLGHKGEYTDPAKAPRPGLILLDLNMPGLDGRKTLQMIKQDSSLKDIPVIILTTSADQRDINHCYQIGANTYIQKPVSFDGLIDAIKRLKEYWFEVAILPRKGAND
jgi:two-component system, response regulator